MRTCWTKTAVSKRTFDRHSVVFAGLAAMLPTTAAAQPDKSVQLNEIVVEQAARARRSDEATSLPGSGPVVGYVARTANTGTKTGAPLIETPQSISVVGQQQTRDLNSQSVPEALNYVSGVAPLNFSYGADFLAIRGFIAQNSGFFLDGLQLYSNGTSAFRIEPFGLERIEILKGPASVLYGGSNVGGIINAVSKVPPQASFGYLETGISNYGNAYGVFDLGGPVSRAADNTVYYRLEGLVRGGGSQVDFINDGRRFIAPSFAWRPDTDTSVTVLGSFVEDRTRNISLLPYVGTVVPAPYGKIPTSRFASDPAFDTFQREQDLIGYQLSHRFNETFAVRQNMRFSDLRVKDLSLISSGYLGPAADGQLLRFAFDNPSHVTETAVDTQIEARFRTGDLRHTTLLGLDYKHYTLSESERFGQGSVFNLLQPTYFGRLPVLVPALDDSIRQDQFAQYLQDQLKYGPFTLVLSGRHDWLEQQRTDRLNGSMNTESVRNAFTGRAGLIYTAPFGLAPYGTYATSFDPQLGTNTATGQTFAPMTGRLGEIGVKYQPTFANATFTAALFDLTQQNVLTSDPSNPTNQIQAGEVRSRGFELGMVASLADGLKVLGSYTGYRLRNTRDADPTAVGKVPNSIPQNFGALFLDYTLQGGLLRGLGAGAGPRFVGASFVDRQNLYAVPSYLLADANLHFDRENWRFALNVRNVFDRSFVSSCSTVAVCIYGSRRTVLTSLAYRW